MYNYVPKECVIQAVQITEETFSKEHPNEEHVKGVVYDPVNKTATIAQSGVELVIGDWISSDKGYLEAWENEQFTKEFQKI